MGQSLKDLLDAVWKEATKEFGSPDVRRPDMKLEQCRSMLNAIEQLFERHAAEKLKAAAKSE